jgi:hypothetical protein
MGYRNDSSAWAPLAPKFGHRPDTSANHRDAIDRTARDRYQISPNKISKHRADHVANRQHRARNQALEERDRMVAIWRSWRKERLETLLAGPHGEAARELMATLEHMPPAPQLIEMLRHGPWRTADADTRFLVLSLVDGAIVHLREKRGLPPFDDALPDERPNVFLLLQEMFNE